MKTLPRAVVTRHYLDDAFSPNLPVMCIDWLHGGMDFTEHAWQLPRGVKVLGPAPVRFGIRVQPRCDDVFDAQLVWNNMHLCWSGLARAELMDGALAVLMKAIDLPIDELFRHDTRRALAA